MLSNGNTQVPNKNRRSNNITPQNISPEKRVAASLLLILLGIASRTFFHLGDNIEYVTSSSLLAGSFLGFPYFLIVPLSIMAVSDFIIGNSMIFIYTWSAFIFIAILGRFFNKSQKSFTGSISKSLFLAFLSSLIFYIWTNFGVWQQDNFGMYSKDLKGLIDSYIMGIPFFKSNLFGNLLFVPLSYLIFPRLLSFKPDKSFFKKILISN